MKVFRPASLLVATVALFAVSPGFAKDKKEKPEKNDWTLNFPETKEHFIKVQLEWAKKEAHWKPTPEELAARFDQLDADHDGKLSKEEWDKRGDKKPAKKEKKK